MLILVVEFLSQLGIVGIFARICVPGFVSLAGFVVLALGEFVAVFLEIVVKVVVKIFFVELFVLFFGFKFLAVVEFLVFLLHLVIGGDDK